MVRVVEAVVPGVPVPQGSTVCIGQRGTRKHTIVDSKAKRLDPWREQIRRRAVGILDERGGRQMVGPVRLFVTFTIPRPKTNRDPYPIGQNTGDLDKFVRAVGDACTQSGLIGDDARIVLTEMAKFYPDSPPLGRHKPLTEPGAYFFLAPIYDEQEQLT